MTRVSASIMAVVTALLLVGCIGLSFKEEELITNRNVSVGQELMDLHEAHEKGIINDTEFEAARQEILKQSNQVESDNTTEKEQKGE